MLGSVLFTIGIGALMLLLGVVVGWWWGRCQAPASEEGSRETMLELLGDLGTWTQRYSGDVSQHQVLLDALGTAVCGADGKSPSSDHVVALLQQVIQSNRDLKSKLAIAEQQLDQKSQQIKWYLSEARTDGLTGLANRRAFDRKLEELFAQHRAGGPAFSIALIDLDHFKSVNDAHGHAEGDRVLVDFAQQLQRELADALLVARFGGEEFAVIFAGPLRESADRMNQLRQGIVARPLAAQQERGPLTISVGVSQPGDDLGAATIVRRADQALYAAKQLGRNRVYFHDGQQPTLVGAPEVVS